MPLRSITDLMPHQYHTIVLSFNHLHRHILHHINILYINTLNLHLVVRRTLLHHFRTLILRPVVRRVLLHHIHTLHHMYSRHIHIFLPEPMVRLVVMLLHHIHTLYLRYIHTLYLNLFIL
jgi:hypothetical protein